MSKVTEDNKEYQRCYQNKLYYLGFLFLFWWLIRKSAVAVAHMGETIHLLLGWHMPHMRHGGSVNAANPWMAWHNWAPMPHVGPIQTPHHWAILVDVHIWPSHHVWWPAHVLWHLTRTANMAWTHHSTLKHSIGHHSMWAWTHPMAHHVRGATKRSHVVWMWERVMMWNRCGDTGDWWCYTLCNRC